MKHSSSLGKKTFAHAKFLKEVNILILCMNIYGALYFKKVSHICFFINTHNSVSIFVSFYRRIDWSSEKYGIVTSKLWSSLYLLTPNLVQFPHYHDRTLATIMDAVFNCAFIEDPGMEIAYDQFLYWPLVKSWGQKG